MSARASSNASAATPGPWSASDAPDGSGIPGWNIRGADGACVCSMMDANRATKAVNPHNARLIVQAVNAHAELIAALEAAAMELLTLHPRLAQPYARSVWAAYEQARAAIAKARGEGGAA